MHDFLHMLYDLGIYIYISMIIWVTREVVCWLFLLVVLQVLKVIVKDWHVICVYNTIYIFVCTRMSLLL